MPLPDVIGEHPQELVEAFNNVVKSYNVVIRLESLECVNEFDETGHSEPYIWPAFLVGDAANLPNFDITVPFEAEAARELLGEAGNSKRSRSSTTSIGASTCSRSSMPFHSACPASPWLPGWPTR